MSQVLTYLCDDVAWYESSPVGKNKLGSMVKEMCIEGNISTKSNHSLRATGATAMLDANVPDKIFQNTTGHRSLESLRKYQKMSLEQHQAVSKVLMSTVNHQNAALVSKESNIGDCGIRSVLRNLTNCSIGNIIVNINRKDKESEDNEEFDKIVKLIDI